MRITALLLTSTLVLGCAAPQVPVRASSVALLGVPASSLRVQRPADDVAKGLGALFDKRGFHLIGKHPAKDGSSDVLYAYKGKRETKVLGAIDSDGAGNTEGAIASYALGSVFYVKIHADGSATDVLVVGKPTVNGQELCSDADGLLKSFEYWCTDTKVSNGGAITPSLMGKEEAETVRGVLLELGAAGGKTPG